MRKRTSLTIAVALVGALALATLASYGAAGNGKGNLKSKRMSSYLEVPSISSTSAKGKIEARIRNSSKIDYKLKYSGLSSAVAQAHIHFGQPGVAAGISAWLCETAGTQSPSASTPTCPQSGTVTGTITATEVIGPAGQGIAAGEFSELAAAMRAGFTYANVHTSNFPDGELRGQIAAGHGNDDD